MFNATLTEKSEDAIGRVIRSRQLKEKIQIQNNVSQHTAARTLLTNECKRRYSWLTLFQLYPVRLVILIEETRVSVETQGPSVRH